MPKTTLNYQSLLEGLRANPQANPMDYRYTPEKAEEEQLATGRSSQFQLPSFDFSLSSNSAEEKAKQVQEEVKSTLEEYIKENLAPKVEEPGLVQDETGGYSFQGPSISTPEWMGELKLPEVPSVPVPNLSVNTGIDLSKVNVSGIDTGIDLSKLSVPSVDTGIDMSNLNLGKVDFPQLQLPSIDTGIDLSKVQLPDFGLKAPEIDLSGLGLGGVNIPGKEYVEALAPGVKMQNGQLAFAPTTQEALNITKKIGEISGQNMLTTIADLGGQGLNLVNQIASFPATAQKFITDQLASWGTNIASSVGLGSVATAISAAVPFIAPIVALASFIDAGQQQAGQLSEERKANWARRADEIDWNLKTADKFNQQINGALKQGFSYADLDNLAVSDPMYSKLFKDQYERLANAESGNRVRTIQLLQGMNVNWETFDAAEYQKKLQSSPWTRNMTLSQDAYEATDRRKTWQSTVAQMEQMKKELPQFFAKMEYENTHAAEIAAKAKADAEVFRQEGEKYKADRRARRRV